MTAQGHPTTRLRRLLASPAATPVQIRSVAAELTYVDIETALMILIVLADKEPGSYSKAAARWGSRLTLERQLGLDDAQLALASLGAMRGAEARAGAEALIELADRHGLRQVEEILMAWMRARGLAD
jgi:hypothetical protein